MMNRTGQGGSRQIAVATLAWFLLAPSLPSTAGEVKQPSKPFSSHQVRFFETEVRPILKARCLKCHGEGPKVKGGFRLDSRESVLREVSWAPRSR